MNAETDRKQAFRLPNLHSADSVLADIGHLAINRSHLACRKQDRCDTNLLR